MAILISSDGLVGAVVVLVFDLTKCAQEEKYILVPPTVRIETLQKSKMMVAKPLRNLPQQNRPLVIAENHSP